MATVVIDVSVCTVVVLVRSSKYVLCVKTIRVKVVERVTNARCLVVNVACVIERAVVVNTVVTSFVE